MPQLRYMTPAEISAAESLGSSAEAWSQVRVSEDFTPFQLLQSHLEGTVEIGSGARIIRSRVCELPDRRGRARRGRHGSRMPPPEHVRQRRGRSDDERVRGPHGQDIRPDVGADSLSDGRLPPPAADRCSAGAHGGGLCRSGCVGDGQRRPRHPHRRREIHPRSPHRRRSVHRRGVDARKRHASATGRISAWTSRPTTSSPPRRRTSTTGRSSNAASWARAAGWTRPSRRPSRSFSQTRTAKTGRRPRSSRVPTPSRTTNRRC